MQHADALISLDQALSLKRTETSELHHQHLNPRLSFLLESIDADRQFTRAEGAFLWDKDGKQYMDFVTGCGTLSFGHNHPGLCAALERVQSRPNLVETLDPLQAALAHNLAVLAPGSMSRVYFVNSGAEAIDTAIKLARAATRRAKLVACRGSFHGRTVGALSVTERPEYREPFGELLGPVEFVPFGDADALETALRHGSPACFIFEPVQAEGGIVVPPPGYLKTAAELCSRYGALMVADEVQTGLGRTGALFAVNHDNVSPDILVLGKALGGGLVPLSAVLTTEDIFIAAGGGTVRTPFHHTTYGGYPRACAVGLAVLELLLAEDLSERSGKLGDYALRLLNQLRDRETLIEDVRGQGLLIGIELAPATEGIVTALTAGVVNHLSRTYFTGLIMMYMLEANAIISAFTANNPNVLRLEPPLTINPHDLDHFVSSLEQTLHDLRSFPRAVMRSLPTSIKALLA